MTKQYLLMVDDEGMARLQKVLGSLQYLEVSGMNISEHNHYKLLVTPVLPRVPDMTMPEKPIESVPA